MNNEPSLSGEQLNRQDEKNQQETIFNEEEFSLEGYDKSIKQARNVLFAVASIEIIFGIFSGMRLSGDDALYSIAITTAIGLVFLALGFWTKNKPYSAIVTGLIFYVSIIVVSATIDIATLFRGVIMKLIVIVYLVKSINDAREAQETKKNFDAR